MKLIIVFASLVLAISALTDEESWTKFKQVHFKTYRSLREDKLRFGIFKLNLRTIEEHNAKYETGEESWFMGVNQFSDLTDEEFQAQYLNSKLSEGFKSTGHIYQPLNVSLADNVDWRDKGAVLSVKDQGSCGSCWAFSSVAALEGQNAIKHGKKVDLSPQELMDCSTSYGNERCAGGLMTPSFSYVKDHGISKLADYPYIAQNSTCKQPHNSAGIKVTGYIEIQPNEAHLKEAVGTVGPISVGINANYIKQYKGGIFNNFFCPAYGLNHAVLAVGYGTENNHDYWIVKNSWGTVWGEKGFIKMTRNRFNQCGIASMASYPKLA